MPSPPKRECQIASAGVTPVGHTKLEPLLSCAPPMMPRVGVVLWLKCAVISPE
jgi:hypothetical protein